MARRQEPPFLGPGLRNHLDSLQPLPSKPAPMGAGFLFAKLQIVNDGCPGETTETMIKGSGVFGPEFCAGGPTGSPFPKAFLHHSYPGTQLEDALAIAKEPGVGTITLDIGA